MIPYLDVDSRPVDWASSLSFHQNGTIQYTITSYDAYRADSRGLGWNYPHNINRTRCALYLSEDSLLVLDCSKFYGKCNVLLRVAVIQMWHKLSNGIQPSLWVHKRIAILYFRVVYVTQILQILGKYEAFLVLYDKIWTDLAKIDSKL